MPITIARGFGERLGEYRRLSGLSAQDLANRVGSLIATRSVVTNLENRPGASVTLDRLFAFAYALGIPPVALALPLVSPFKEISVIAEHWDTYPIDAPNPAHHAAVNVRVLDLVDWWGWPVSSGAGSSGLGDTVTRLILSGLRDYKELESKYLDAKARGEADAATRTLIALEMHAVNLRGLGVDVPKIVA